MVVADVAHHIAFEAIGTHWDIEIFDERQSVHCRRATNAIQARIARFDRTYSRFRDDSLLMQLARQPGSIELPTDGKCLFDYYERLYKVTAGAVTPLVGDLLVDAGYDASYSLAPKSRLSAALRWEDVLAYDYPSLGATRAVVLDVGAAGKGYLVDIISELLRDMGFRDFLIDAGGDMRRSGPVATTVPVGLEHPLDPTLAVGIIQLGNESVCASAGNRRQWAGLHHIMNPVTAVPVSDIIATWAVAETAMIADGLATALFLTPAEILKNTFSFEYCLIRSDMSFECSPGLQVEMFGGDDE